MTFFNTAIPLLSRKRLEFTRPTSPDVQFIHVRVHNRTLFLSFYTRHDQACLLWGMISFSIFGAAQFALVDWITQATIASILTVVGVTGMAVLMGRFLRFDAIAWILYIWIVLMGMGIILTDAGLYYGWSFVLGSLCPLWLGLCGVGYTLTGWGMRSRLILGCGALHFLAILVLPWLTPWQPLATGLVIGGCVTALGELQWDANGVCEYQTHAPPDQD